MEASSQSGVLLHRVVSRRLVRGALASDQPGGRGGADRGGEPGNRLCHIQVPRRQDGLPTLIGAGRRRAHPAAAGPADRAERRLAPVRQLRRQAVLAQAGGARPGAAPRVAGAAVRVLGAARHDASRSSTASGSAIVGGNGAGKSTLLRLLARIYPPTIGQVSIRGSVAPLIEMGAGFNPELSGLDNIVFNGAMLGFSRSQMLAKVDRDPRVHRPARVRRHAAEVLFQRHVHAAGLRHRHRGQSRHPADRRVAGRRRRRVPRKSQGPAPRACSSGPTPWSSSLTI